MCDCIVGLVVTIATAKQDFLGPLLKAKNPTEICQWQAGGIRSPRVWLHIRNMSKYLIHLKNSPVFILCCVLM